MSGDWTRTTLRGIGTISGDLVAPVKTVNGNSNLAVLWPCQTSSAGLAGSSYLCCKGVSLGKQAMAAGKLVRQIVIARAPTPSFKSWTWTAATITTADTLPQAPQLNSLVCRMADKHKKLTIAALMGRLGICSTAKHQMKLLKISKC